MDNDEALLPYLSTATRVLLQDEPATTASGHDLVQKRAALQNLSDCSGNVFLADVQKAFYAQNLRSVPIHYSMILHDRATDWKASVGVMTFWT